MNFHNINKNYLFRSLKIWRMAPRPRSLKSWLWVTKNPYFKLL